MSLQLTNIAVLTFTKLFRNFVQVCKQVGWPESFILWESTSLQCAGPSIVLFILHILHISQNGLLITAPLRLNLKYLNCPKIPMPA